MVIKINPNVSLIKMNIRIKFIVKRQKLSHWVIKPKK